MVRKTAEPKQRFGSRRGLQVAVAAHVADQAPDLFAELKARHRAPLSALRAYAACCAGMADSPAAVARNLAYLLQDLTDPALNIRVRAQARRTRIGLRHLVRDAVRAGALKANTDVRALARTIEAVLGGSMLAAVYHQGSAARWLARDLEQILRPHLPSGSGARRLRETASAQEDDDG